MQRRFSPLVCPALSLCFSSHAVPSHTSSHRLLTEPSLFHISASSTRIPITSVLDVYVCVCVCIELRDFEPDDQQEIEVDEGNTAVIECHLPESQPQAQVRYSVKQEWLETSKGKDSKISGTFISVLSFLPPSISRLVSRTWFCWNAGCFICTLLSLTRR